ncbi:Saccharopine dehydrogenase [NADP(+), L-glutamate-forming] [Yarrowia sp. C11]|nr:Saccharopine dehydrogenase [NADP(+), L-glutamate-forming] [Yarrowia sp. E02]KAG5367697.1 Saccharopine dehydrogenase [NADP(+), L-glutamate-forming] [Yarrowia sp. C11]
MAAKQVLLLGSGFVAKPTVDILAATDGIEVTVACRTLDKAKALAGDVAKAKSVDVENPESLDAAIAECDLVISLIPYIHHATVIKSAIKHKKNVVTTSYVSPAIQALEQEAKDAGIVVMNEIGLDPGIDHLYAVKTIDEVHRAGGKIKSFLSYCGGLPSPEDSDNPLGYKFSWSSRGVLLALRNAAKFYKDGKIEEVSGEDLMTLAKPYFIYPGYAFVCYPNRDSSPYKERYEIPEADTIIRGTLRFQGFPEFIKVLVDLGFLSDDNVETFAVGAKPAWKDALAAQVGAKGSSEEEIIAAISSKTKFKDEDDKERIINGFRWLGLFSETPITARGNPLDTLCATLEEKMQFGPRERDMVMLQHKFGIEWADGKTETRTSTLVAYGNPDKYSAMAELVGVPCAVAVKQVLNGTISTPGILAPVNPAINGPLIKELKEDYGIELIEKTL